VKLLNIECRWSIFLWSNCRLQK